MDWPNVSDDPTIQCAYEHMRDQGQSHSLAEMFAFQQPPGSNTDREFLHGHVNGNQFSNTPEIGDYYKKVTERLGGSTTGKVYKRSLAAFPGDPRAWVSGKDDVRKVCEERGWNCDGDVKVVSEQKAERPKSVKLATSTVNRLTKEYLQKEPGLRKKRVEEVKEMVIDKHGSKL